MQQTTKLNIVAIDDQEDHKVGKLAKKTTEPVELSSGQHYCKDWQIRNMLLLLQRMVVAKIKETGSRDIIRAVRLSFDHITKKERCREKEAPLH